jgi:hypothetical protein
VAPFAVAEFVFVDGAIDVDAKVAAPLLGQPFDGVDWVDLLGKIFLSITNYNYKICRV